MGSSRSASSLLFKLGLCSPVAGLLIWLLVFGTGESNVGYLLFGVSGLLCLLSPVLLFASVALGIVASVARRERVPWVPWAALILLAELVAIVWLGVLSFR